MTDIAAPAAAAAEMDTAADVLDSAARAIDALRAARPATRGRYLARWSINWPRSAVG